MGGLITFVSMAYIIVVNPAILQNVGIDPQAGAVATILAAAFGCLLMGLYANRPFAVAPYMGENAFLAFGLTQLLGEYPRDEAWRLVLGVVFISGILFLLLTLLGLRRWIASAISNSLKHSFSVGIGLFLLLLGLLQTGIIVKHPVGPALSIGNWQGDAKTQLAIAGFLIIAVLTLWNVRAAILIGILVTALTGLALGLGEWPDRLVSSPWEAGYHLSPLLGQFDLQGVLRWSFLPVLLTLFLMTFLDTLGTLLALGSSANLLDKDGNLPDIDRPMLVDSLACIFSACVGTSASGAYIESATGIRAGARTGLAAVVTGLLFLAALCFLPIFGPLQKLQFAIGPALIMVGVLMFGSVRHLDFDDFTELIPALVTIVLMVFTLNIANGMTAGLLLHPVLKACAGRWREVHPAGVLLGVFCLLYFVLGVVH